MFLGLSPGKKAYKQYNLDTNQVLVSRDVIFKEHVYPFDKQVIKDKVTPLPAIDDEIPDSISDVEDLTEEIPPEN